MIEEFRGEVTRHGGRTWVHDPARFKLEDLLDLITKSPLEPVEPPQGDPITEPPPPLGGDEPD